MPTTVNPMRERLRRIWRESIRPLLVLVLLLTSFRSAIADWNDVPSGSMEPTILEGDRVFVNRAAYDLKVPFTTWRLAQWADPRRGDIVVLASPVDGTRLIKRVVGVPGDVIEVRQQRLIVNGESARYAPMSGTDALAQGRSAFPAPAMAHETLEQRTHYVLAEAFGGPGSDVGPLRVPAGHYFLMGDHRDVSYDSRFWGFVERRAILGRAVGVAFSLDRGRHFIPRRGRFVVHLD